MFFFEDVFFDDVFSMMFFFRIDPGLTQDRSRVEILALTEELKPPPVEYVFTPYFFSVFCIAPLYSAYLLLVMALEQKVFGTPNVP